MPLYEYQCDACGHRFELIQKYSDPPPAACPKCGGTVQKMVSSPAFQFKGTGWYVTDYGSKKNDSSRGSSSKKSDSGSGDSGNSSESKESGSKDSGSKDSGSKDSSSSESSSKDSSKDSSAAPAAKSS